MDTKLSHKVRGGLGKETAYTLTDQGLSWEADGVSGAVPFGEIKQINLKTYPVDIADPDVIHGQMMLKTKSGERLKVHSHHYEHLVHTSRVGTYGPLVRALCQRAAAENPKVRFTNGAPVMRTLYFALAAICGVFTALFGLLVVFVEVRRDLLLACAVSLTVTAAAWSFYKGSKTHEFDGADPPDHLLTF